MHVMFVLHSERAFSTVLEGVPLIKNFACLNLLFCADDAPQLIAFTIH